ncbi:uncharacterized protein LOC100371264 [Saccoglossus kowalevskii]|uniref:Uncharacterized protein LOC100371264 n=1 Tax=Saccoglossus kowalevskii TaxID=10224 RepID=A0ABM0MBS9_SACKO|nr:PREDICTED: uncharacterized protein LOC100371264 [Saccoglossus kowalevskii]
MDLRTVFILTLAIAATRVLAGVQECHSCNGVSSNYYCRQNTVTCNADQHCQTVIENVGGSLETTKKCVDIDICSSDQSDNDEYCEFGIVKDSCSYCCDEELCNDELPYYHEVYDDCSPWSCWSSCEDCSRRRTRTCDTSSKSKKSSGGSNKHSSGSKSGSKSGSGSGETEEEEVDDCCSNTCYSCSSLAIDPTDSLLQLADVFLNCESETCVDNEMVCKTEISYTTGVPVITKGCATHDECRNAESGDQCPALVDDDSEAILVALDLIDEDIDCNYCCDNGDDDNSEICNSGIVPPPQYDINRPCSDASSQVGNFLATFAMAVLVRLFAI